MRQLTHGSLFAGIGGFDLGFERAGIKTIWQVEIDEYCRRVLARHWPNVQRFSDVRECGRHNLRPVDIIVGGFPCQDISTAGARAGIEGERSGLWAEMFRIIRELRSTLVVVENVAALSFRGLGRLLGDLASIGYDAEWDCVSAEEFGAPHLRQRLFIVCYPAGSRLESGAAFFISQPRRGAWWSPIPQICRVVDGIPNRLVRPELSCLGNAVVPQIAEWLGRRIIAAEAVRCEGQETINTEG